MQELDFDFNSKVCDRKVPYRTYESAAKAAERMIYKTRTWLHPYQCFECGKYHIGHSYAMAEKYGELQDWLCPVCGLLVPEKLMMRQKDDKLHFCSRDCRKIYQQKEAIAHQGAAICRDDANNA
jgi:hypothetical protein